MANNQLKILVTGSANGQYQKLFKRVTDVNQKAGPFDILLCIGDFFGDDLDSYNDLITGSIDFPSISTYILGPIPADKMSQLHPNVENFEQGCELTDGITYLGRVGVLNTSQGLRIAYLSGSYCQSPNSDRNLEHYNDKDLETLVMSCQALSNPVDLLLTNEWPEGVFNFLTVDDSIKELAEKYSSVKMAQICHKVRPRYHFIGCKDNPFYERPPFRYHRVLAEAARHVTRIISMADVANSKKMKWIYAFNMVPSSHLSQQELTAQPDVVTDNPFKGLIQENQRNEEDLRGRQQQFRFDMSGSNEEQHGHHKRRRDDRNNTERRPRKEMKVDMENCWFCLASPNVDKSLIVSIGEHSYLALAKGGLTDDHMMILPIEHIRSTIEIENEDLREEIDRFKSALVDFYRKRQMVPVFFERNFKSAHFQIQVIGLPQDRVSNLKQAVLEVFGKFDPNELGPEDVLEDVVPPNVPYFFWECPGHYRFFVRINTRREFFPIQIGRELMAHKLLLDCPPERVDWKLAANSLDTGAIQQITQKMRRDFKEFDFTV